MQQFPSSNLALVSAYRRHNFRHEGSGFWRLQLHPKSRLMTSINSSSPSTQIRSNPYHSDFDVYNFFISSSTVRITFTNVTLFPHCTVNPIYAFSEIKLRGIVPNSYIHASVSNSNIPRISLPIWMQQIGRPILGIRKLLTDTWMWKLGDRTI